MGADNLQDLFRDIIPVIAIIALFTLLSIATWTNARKKEREAFYRSEVRKKLIENWSGENAEQLLKLMREQSKSPELHQWLNLAEDESDNPRRRRERLLLAGLITTAIGGGTLIFLKTMPEAVEASNVGLIPLFVGLAILIYSLFVGRA